MSYSIPSRVTPGPAGQGDYNVAEGDCMESIAVDRGYFWETLWNHPRNATLKKARACQNLLLPGDRVHIPDKVEKHVDRPTDNKHRFVRKGVPSKLRVCVKRGGDPLRNQPYSLVVDGKPFMGLTDGDGWIEVAIPGNAQRGQLSVGSNPHNQQVFSLELGGMDPITEITGIQKRLRNLGFGCHSSGEMDDATLAALTRFQAGEELKPTGIPDAATLETLKQRHGS
jgi:hypothetical protein